MTAIETFSELGSGFNIAMKDLEIRGAGDILGGEQSGFMNEIGFDTYQKILNEAIEELKENEFKDLYDAPVADKKHVSDVTIDTDIELQFADDYVNSITERLALYTALNEVNTEEELNIFKASLIDRFGTLPPESEELLTSLKIKWIAARIGLERVVLKEGKMVGYFIADQASSFYKSPAFMAVMKAIQEHPRELRIKEKQTRAGLRLLLLSDNVKTIDRALQVLNFIKPLGATIPVAE
jgi:transcription-repair coupling factor (superfamily II helicase)